MQRLSNGDSELPGWHPRQLRGAQTLRFPSLCAPLRVLLLVESGLLLDALALCREVRVELADGVAPEKVIQLAATAHVGGQKRGLERQERVFFLLLFLGGEGVHQLASESNQPAFHACLMGLGNSSSALTRQAVGCASRATCTT